MSYQSNLYTEEQIKIVSLSNDFIQAKIAINVGCTLYSLIYNNIETIYFNDTLLNYGTHKKLAGIPFMHPWSNRLNGDVIFNKAFECTENLNKILYRDANHLPLHGLLLKSDKWELDEIYHDNTQAYCIAKFNFNDETMLSIFPFPHLIFLKIKLEKNELSYEVKIENKSGKEMPLCFGFHPYFNLENSNTHFLQTPNATIVEVDEHLIPSGNIVPRSDYFNFESDVLDIKNAAIDHAFLQQEKNCNYKLITTNYTVEFVLDDAYKVVQIYHPNATHKPYICIEPMLATANALNTNYDKKIDKEIFIATYKMCYY
jgi:aldose 1-epimerase